MSDRIRHHAEGIAHPERAERAKARAAKRDAIVKAAREHYGLTAAAWRALPAHIRRAKIDAVPAA